MFENKTPSSFNRGRDSGQGKQTHSLTQGLIRMFENNTLSNPCSKVFSCATKKVLNRSNFLLETLSR
ncbi:hypothetical protein GOM44_00350 [Wolbachia endosymbiont of Atemnus politus]|uniref:hypothetical protein n=1 Tax=Wolbachia endosymbiont of Atemnus politus TaxID=2682840 RepID=UPI001572EFA9|nr:hypothetical protein [Wolbachia endosymbiont of Atemnus politus]NSX82996.1 hypothetical protein [Wolbachia endosymbiont of Atemnus politus]